MKVEFDKTLTNKWVKMPYWYGNPELGLDCWGKKFNDYVTTCVYVFGKIDKHKELHQITDFHYVVRGSHSGMFESNSSAEEVMKYVDLRYKLKLLDHGRNLTEDELKKL